MMAEMPLLKKKFLHYRQYAGMGIDELLDKGQLSKAVVKTVDQTQTSVFYNDGRGHFTMAPLPQRAQFSPVFAAINTDLNGDNRNDIFMGGNFYGLKPEVGRYDASYGVALLGSGTRNFTFAAPANTGLFLTGEIRDIKQIKTAKGTYILVARNNEALQIFKRN
jgi:hypothetical protein